MTHVPVLLNETLEYLNAKDGLKFIDGTVGGGGHALVLLEQNDQAKVLGIDLDASAIAKLKQGIPASLKNRCLLIQGNYSDVYSIAAANDFLEASGVLLDLGFASYHVDNPERGFSFQSKGPLDMRYDQSQKLRAWDVVNKYSEEKLGKVIREYGDERHYKKIASKVVRERNIHTIDDTFQLYKVISGGPHTGRRIFQAIRMEVNSEIENLKRVLPEVLKVLAPGGRMVIISFHSIEDRVVKWFFRDQATAGRLKILTKKPVRPSLDEIHSNPRSNAAKLRAAEKL